MRAAIVIDGVVTNIVMIDPTSGWQPEAGELVPLDGVTAGIGWLYTDGNFVAPEQEDDS